MAWRPAADGRGQKRPDNDRSFVNNTDGASFSMTDATASASATTLLYQTDAYLRDFDATVVAVDAETGAVALDRTAFFPSGGGQPHDTGEITRPVDGKAWRVASVRKAGPLVLHALGAADDLPSPGDLLHGELDWPTRYRLMRTHTALHVLCGVVFRDYGAPVTGGNMGPDKARMDFEMEDFTPERVAEIERRANEEIALGRDVRVRILPRDEAFQIPDLIRTKINLLPEGITEIRTVEIVGLDVQADGGTHVANTREVGGLKVVGTRSKGKSNKRLEIVLIGGDGDSTLPS
ncbi:MAG: alanyl-tRNA editing protein [Thermomicrobiales bacterium]